tara:strand:- start:29 stop:325 length:297 start_codon:yes stop_codon:yes gene_type:complete
MEKINLLEQAINKITIKMLDSMENGETIVLNKRFDLYKYLEGYTIGLNEWEEMEEPSYFVLEDKKYNEETICVQYGNNEIDFTDVYGYDEDEDYFSLK